MQKRTLSKAIQIALYSTGAILPLAGHAQTSSANEATTLAPVVVDSTRQQDAGSYAVTEGTGRYTISTMRSSTGLPLSVKETPQSVTVVTQQQMQDQNLNTMAKVLDSTPGISVQAVDRGRNSFSSRGFAIDKQLIDGLNVNYEAAYGSGETKQDMAIYDHVEITRGASGLLSGVGEPSAQVNFIRKRAGRERRTVLQAGIDRYAAWNLMLDHTQPFTQDGRVRGRLVLSHSPKGKTFVDREKLQNTTLYGIVEADLSDSTQLSVGVSHQDERKRGVMWGGLPVLFDDGTLTDWPIDKNSSANWTRWDSKNTNYFMYLSQKLGSKWTLDFNANYRDAESDSKLFYFSGNTVRKADGLGWSPWPYNGHNSAKQTNVQLQATGSFEAWGREHDLTFGVQHSRRNRSSHAASGNKNIAPASNFFTWDGSYAEPTWGNMALGDKVKQKETGVYAAARLSITDKFSTILGSRVSWFDHEGWNSGRINSYKVSSEWTPYAGLLYDITPNQTVYASYTRIFKPQNYYDANNKLLDPVRGNSYEIGWKGEFFNGGLTTQAAVFRTKQDNLAQSTGQYIAGVTPPTYAYRAAKGAKVDGFEIELAGNVTEDLKLGAGYTQWSGKDRDGKAINTTHPRKQFKLFASYDMHRLVPGLNVGAGVNWQGRTYTTTSNAATNGTIEYGEGSYAVANLMARYQISKNLSAQLNIDNLFNKKYRNQLSFSQYSYGEPRTVSANVRYEF